MIEHDSVTWALCVYALIMSCIGLFQIFVTQWVEMIMIIQGKADPKHNAECTRCYGKSRNELCRELDDVHATLRVLRQPTTN